MSTGEKQAKDMNGQLTKKNTNNEKYGFCSY